MAQFFDLHNHMLCGVDDGAKTPEQMLAMLEASYADGTRALCLTPHYSPYLFGDTSQKALAAFEALKHYVAEKHPDMHLFLGHELGYHNSALEALNDGKCRSIAPSRWNFLRSARRWIPCSARGIFQFWRTPSAIRACFVRSTGSNTLSAKADSCRSMRRR